MTTTVHGLRRSLVLAAKPTAGPWRPTKHPNATVAELFTLGGIWIVRNTGEAHYDLYHPSCALPVLSGSLAECREEGERRWKLDTDQDLEKAGERPEYDVIVSDHGDTMLILPRTPEAAEWLTEHVDEDAMWYGQSLVVERSFISPLLEGMMRRGLRVSA